jgi:hypothetical protein
MRALRIALASLAATFLAASASAGPLTPDSRREIDRIMDLVVNNPTVVETQYFTMTAGEVISVPFIADATAEYYVNVVSDDHATNVDLVGLDADGTEADVDDFDGPSPSLNIQASEYRSPVDKPTGKPVRSAASASGSRRS